MPKEVSFKELANFSPKQLEALNAVKQYKFLLYGGAAGGGKSYFLRWCAIYLLLLWGQKGIKNVRVGLFCEDYPALKDRHLNRIDIEFPPALGHLNKSDKEFVLHASLGGGRISFRNLDEPGKYASSEFAAVLVDEVTKNQKEVFDMLRFRMRWPGISDTKFIGATNPGSKGHGWVKKKWIKGEHEIGEKEADQFFFVQSRAYDNPHLDKSYFLTLEGLPPELKKAFLDGDWDLVQGQFFEEWRQAKHVEPRFNPPEGWFKYRSIDFGRTAPFCCKWYAVDYDKRVHVYREYYRANTDADMNFREVARLSQGETYQWSVMDAAAFAATTGAAFNRGLGETIADIAWKNGVEVMPSAKNRMAGWTLMHEYLRWQHYDMEKEEWVETIPKMVYMEGCFDSIRTIPELIFDKHNNEDLDTNGEDHAADTDSYFLQALSHGGPDKEQAKPRRTFSLAFQNNQNEDISAPDPAMDSFTNIFLN